MSVRHGGQYEKKSDNRASERFPRIGLIAAQRGATILFSQRGGE